MERKAQERRQRGERFKALRLRQGLHTGHVAFQLRCGEEVIEAFEAGEPWEIYINELPRLTSLMLKWTKDTTIVIKGGN